MANGYIHSNNIRIFPCANRSATYANTSRRTTEYNLVSIVNRLVDRDYFVLQGIESEPVTSATGTAYVFNIRGYIVETTLGSIFSAVTFSDGSTSYKIYAKILFDSVYSSEGTALSLLSLQLVNLVAPQDVDSQYILDQTSEFTGVRFIASKDSLTEDDSINNAYLRCILECEYNSTTGIAVMTTPQDALLKFETNTAGSHRSVKIDDGIL